MEAARNPGLSESALAKLCRADGWNAREGLRIAGAAICEWTVWMTWRMREPVVTSGECGAPVVRMDGFKRNPGQSWEVTARQSPQASSCGEQGKATTSSTLSAYVRRGCAASQRRRWKKSKPKERVGSCEHTSGETFSTEARRGRTIRLDKA